MQLEITFTGKNSQIGEYIKGDYNFVSYDLMSPETWEPLLKSDVVFLLLPKSKDTLEMVKRFTVSAMNSNIKQIVKEQYIKCANDPVYFMRQFCFAFFILNSFCSKH